MSWIVDYFLDTPSGESIPVRVTIALDQDTQRTLTTVVLGAAGIVTAGVLGGILLGKKKRR